MHEDSSDMRGAGLLDSRAKDLGSRANHDVLVNHRCTRHFLQPIFRLITVSSYDRNVSLSGRSYCTRLKLTRSHGMTRTGRGDITAYSATT